MTTITDESIAIATISHILHEQFCGQLAELGLEDKDLFGSHDELAELVHKRLTEGPPPVGKSTFTKEDMDGAFAAGFDAGVYRARQAIESNAYELTESLRKLRA